MWTFRAGLDPVLREDVRQAFIRLRAPDALHAYRAESFIPAVDADVDRVRYWMEDILRSTLDEQKNTAEHLFLKKPAAQLAQAQSFNSVSTC